MNFKRPLNLSYATTSVALEGPRLVTLIVNITKSPTFAAVTLTALVTFKSTTGNAVMLSIVSLLFDLFVSFSLLLIVTKLEIVPFDMTRALMVSVAHSPLTRVPTFHIPVVTL